MKVYSAQLNYLEEIKKAESGDIEAMVKVAFAILNGNKTSEIEPDEAELAIRYYKLAAKAGNKSAMLDLGACYMDGRGVTRDVEEALQWYERGWDPDDPRSSYCLGCINRYDYLEDQSEVPTADPNRIQKAIDYFRIGEKMDDADCMYELGELYITGIGVNEDKEKAFQLYNKAYEFLDREILSDRALRIILRLAECWHYGWGTYADINEAEEFITEFRDEQRRRELFGEKEEAYLLKRAEQEWVAIYKEMED